MTTSRVRNEISYCVMRYRSLTGEILNLGVMFEFGDTGRGFFFHTKQWDKVELFITEVSVQQIRHCLEQIRHDVEMLSRWDKFCMNDFIVSPFDESPIHFTPRLVCGDVEEKEKVREVVKRYLPEDVNSLE